MSVKQAFKAARKAVDKVTEGMYSDCYDGAVRDVREKVRRKVYKENSGRLGDNDYTLVRNSIKESAKKEEQYG
jgi:hypothetical protein